MFSSPQRARSVTRIAVGLVALGASFLGASAAQGSIGTGNQVTTNRPDIRTTTIIPTFNEVEYCFDGPVDLSAGGPFRVGGYVSSALSPGSAGSKSSANCIQSQYASTTDLQSATYGHVLAGAVKNSVGSLTNLTDSAPLIGSITKNGTRGNSVGPDLTIAAANVGGASNQIGFRFDQRIITTAGACAGAPSAQAGFAYYDNNGNIHNDGTVISCSNTSNADGSGNGNVLVAFPPATSPVEESRRAYVANNQVFSTPPTTAGNPTFSVVVVGGSGTNSNDPDLLSVELSDPAGTTNSLDFTFDEGITAPVAARFHAVTANLAGGTVVDGTNVALLDSSNGTNTRARVQFPQLELFSEFIIGGYVDCANTQGTPPAPQAANVECTGASAAVSANDGQKVPPNGLPAGDNANAFSLGWTTGPDPVSASKNVADRSVTVRMDQRMISTTAGPAQLVDTTGLTGIFCTPNAIFTLGAPGQQNVTWQCPSGSDMAAAVGIYLQGPPTAAGGTVASTIGGPNADQIVGIG